MATTAETLAIVRRQLAPSGVLRAAINTANFLLVTSYDDAGLPQGVSPDMAMALAEKLSVQCRLIPYKTPSDVADAMATESWDIANIGAEPERAKIIKFSPAYSEIQATYLLPPGSSIEKMADVDKEGHRIVAMARRQEMGGRGAPRSLWRAGGAASCSSKR